MCGVYRTLVDGSLESPYTTSCSPQLNFFSLPHTVEALQGKTYQDSLLSGGGCVKTAARSTVQFAAKCV